MFNVKESTRAASMAAQRAGRRLAELGLIEYVHSLAVKTKGPSIIRTPLGDEVVARYRHELETGQRIRWPKED
jgi:hypothetical protein